jgi:hypothetical protein
MIRLKPETGGKRESERRAEGRGFFYERRGFTFIVRSFVGQQKIDKQINPVTSHRGGQGCRNIDSECNIAERQPGKGFRKKDKEGITWRMR